MATFIPWLPDNFVATFEWRTDVLRADDGTEQRIALWNHPKVTFALEYNMVGDEIDGDTALALRVMRSTLTNNPEETYQIPLRHESSFLTADAAISATQLFLDYNRALDWVGNGRKVYVETDENEEGYTALISSYTTVGSDVRLTLDTAAPYALDKTRVRVSPVVNIQPMDHQALGRYRVEAGTWTISGVLQTLYMFNQGTGITVPETEDCNVWLREAVQNSTDLIGEDFTCGLEIIGEPLMEAFTQFPKALIKRDLTFSLDGLDDWRYFKAVLFTALGQQVPFFRPTFRDDLTLEAQPASPSSVLLVSDTPDYTDYYTGADTFKRLALFLSDGSVLTVRITDVEDNLDGTLTLTTADTFARGANTIDRVALLETTRLGSDAVVLTSKRGVRATLELQTLTGDWVPVPVMV